MPGGGIAAAIRLDPNFKEASMTPSLETPCDNPGCTCTIDTEADGALVFCSPECADGEGCECIECRCLDVESSVDASGARCEEAANSPAAA
jgi:hypothetical protein